MTVPGFPSGHARALAAWAAQHGYVVVYSRLVSGLDGTLKFTSRLQNEVRYALAVDDPWLILGTQLGVSDALIGHPVPGGGRRAEGTCEAGDLIDACRGWLDRESLRAPMEIVDTVEGIQSVARHAQSHRLDVGWR